MQEPGTIIDVQIPPQKRERKVTLGTSLPISISEIVDDAAAKMRVSTSHILRIAVLSYLRRHGYDLGDYAVEGE